jgi:UDP-glucose 4-epimerase
MTLRGKRVLVTGGAGFIGSHVVEDLLREGAKVTVVDNFSTGSMENLADSKKYIKIVDMDVRNVKITDLIKKQDVIMHLAGNADVPVSVKDPSYEFKTNIVGSQNVLQSCLHTKVKKVIFASSGAVYGEPEYIPMDESHPTNPRSPYAASKLAVENIGSAYHKTYGLPFVSLRLFNTYGPRLRRFSIYDMITRLRRDKARLEIIGTGQQVRDYCYITDASKSFVAAAKSDRSVGQIYNIAGGGQSTVADVAQKIVGSSDYRGAQVECNGKTWPGDITKLVGDITKAKLQLGFASEVTLDQGLIYTNVWIEGEGQK